MGLQPINSSTQEQHNKELTDKGKASLQTSLQTNPKNASNQNNLIPPDLAEIMSAWPELPTHIKAAIKALIEFSTSKS